MSRLFVFAILAILLADASGVIALVSPEPCTSATDTVPDGKCPALCVRCACCAQPIVPMMAPAITSADVSFTTPMVYRRAIIAGSPHDILHVPK